MTPASGTFTSFFQQSLFARRYALIAALLCFAYYALEWKNGRAQMADFRVYYDAASAFASDTQVYGLSFGVSSGFYKYSPFACLPFLPFAALPYPLASALYYLLVTAAIVWFSLYLIYHLENRWPAVRTSSWILVLTTVFMLDHLERELHLGNVNLFLLIGAFFILDFLKKGKDIGAGIIFALLLLFKPHFLLLLPWFVWKKRWKMLLLTAAGILAGLVLPTLWKGVDGNIALLQQWMHAMQDHNMRLENSPNTVYGIINHFLLGNSAGFWLVIIGLALVGGGFLLLMLRNKRKRADESLSFIEFFLLVALIPNLVHTDTEHFMWTWPLIAYCIYHLFTREIRGKQILITSLVLAFIPYCLNSPDIVGRELRFLFDEGGLLGLANLIIAGCAIAIHLQNRLPNTSAEGA